MHLDITGFYRWLFISLILFISACNPAQEPVAQAVTSPDEIGKLFDQWNASLLSGDPDAVVRHYATHAILLPTVSNKVRRNHEEIRDYFEHFLALDPDGRINQQNIRIFDDIAVNSGIYTFAITRDGEPDQVQARYTFVYQKIGDDWLIVDHHSSAMPEHVAPDNTHH